VWWPDPDGDERPAEHQVSSRRPAGRARVVGVHLHRALSFSGSGARSRRRRDGKGPGRPIVPGLAPDDGGFSSGKARGMCQAAAMMGQRTRISPRPHIPEWKRALLPASLAAIPFPCMRRRLWWGGGPAKPRRWATGKSIRSTILCSRQMECATPARSALSSCYFDKK